MPAGFKTCSSCRHSFSRSDPHALCLECLGPDHRLLDCLHCGYLSVRALRSRLQRWRQIFGASPPPEFWEHVNRRRRRGKAGNPPRVAPTSGPAQEVEGRARPTPGGGLEFSSTGSPAEGRLPLTEAPAQPRRLPESSEGASVPCTGFAETARAATGVVYCYAEAPNVSPSPGRSRTGLFPPVHQIFYKMQKFPDDTETAVGVFTRPHRREGPSASLGQGPAAPAFLSPLSRSFGEADPVSVMGPDAYEGAQLQAVPGFRVPPPRRTQWSGEWHRESTFTDDRPHTGPTSAVRRFHTEYEEVSHSETEPGFEPVPTPEPELLNTFTRLLTSETMKSYMVDLMKQTLPGLLVTPAPPTHSPKGIGRGGPVPAGPAPPRVIIPEPRAAPVEIPLLEPYPPLPPGPPPRNPTPPPLPDDEGDNSDEDVEGEGSGGTPARAIHQAFDDALGWLGMATPGVKRTVSGVLAAVATPAPRTGIKLQPDVMEGAAKNWQHPHSTSAVHKRVDMIHRMLPNESLCLSTHPPANSLVVSAAVSQGKSPAAATVTPAGKEEKLLDAFGKKIYTNASLHLRQANSDAILAAANHRLWEKIQVYEQYLPEEAKQDFTAGLYDAQQIAQMQLNSVAYHIDTASRAMCIGVDMRRQAWLKSTTLQQEAHDRVIDLPFDGRVLFAEETDTLLEKCTTGAKTAKSLMPISRPPPKQQGASSGGNRPQAGSSAPAFRGFMKRQKARDDKGNRPSKKKGGSAPTPRSSGPPKKD